MNNIDLVIFRWANSWAGINSFYDWAIIFRAEYLAWIVGIGILAFLVFGKDKKCELWMLIHAFASAIAARFVFTEIIRYFYNRSRPFEVLSNVHQLISHETGGSFPSGHTAFFFALAMGIYYYHRAWGIVFLLSVLSIGFGRVAAGLHWPSDVLGGAVVGVLSAMLLRWLFKKFQNQKI